jgi:hypothetical protein
MQNKAFNPIRISLFSADTVMLKTNFTPDLMRGVAIFAKDFSGHPARKNQQKCTRPLMPSAAPIRPRHLVSTQQGVET